MAYGMFGPDTADIQATLDAENWQKRYKGDSLEDSVGNLFQSGFGLAAKALGAEDPRMSKAKKMEEVKKYAQENAKGNDTLSYYKSLSEAFKKFGMIEEAMNIEKVIAELEGKQQDRELKKQEFGWKKDDRAAEREQKLEIARMKAQGKDPESFKMLNTLLERMPKLTPESVLEIWDSFNSSGISAAVSKAQAYEKEPKPTDRRPASIEADGKVYVLNDEVWNTADPKDRHPTIKGYVVAGSAPNRQTQIVNHAQKGESAFVTELGKLDAKRFIDLTEKQANAQKVQNLMKELKPKVKNAYTGALSDWKQAASMVFSAFGLSTPAMDKAMKATGSYQSAVKQLVLDQIKALGSGTAISDRDREYVDTMTPRLKENPETIYEIMDYISRRAAEELQVSLEGQAFARKNRGFVDNSTGEVWNKVPVTPPPSNPDETYKGKPLSEMTAEELAAAKRAARK